MRWYEWLGVLWIAACAVTCIVGALTLGGCSGATKFTRPDGTVVTVPKGHTVDLKGNVVPIKPPEPAKPSKSGNPTVQLIGAGVMVLAPVAGYFLGALMAGIIGGLCGAALLGVDRFFAMYTWVMFIPFGLGVLWLIYQWHRGQKTVNALVEGAQRLKQSMPLAKEEANTILAAPQIKAGVQKVVDKAKRRLGL